MDALHPDKIDVIEAVGSSDDGRKYVEVIVEGKRYGALLAEVDGEYRTETHIFVPELNRTFIL
ncbi:MAG: hypothetical protein KAR40_09595 [Candidatus Sabulitectum sp.]|nr:hypothetical protein [Candidatus Sabulitectum sp.]